ncbi:MAG TPA: TetR/AcrR family transcriptional regulator [Trebonia sp.]|nr:TetR/AcrR family transcriptional regulator [Trebonia sp.]
MTAEQLFAEHGIAAVPLRDIGIAAGQKNHAVVQYHFGDRESLVREIIAFRATLSERLRVEMFADLVSRGQPKVADLVRVFVLPLAAHLEQRSHYLAFMSRYITERGGYRGLESMGLPSATVATLRSLLGRLLPDHPTAVLDERWMVLMTSTIHTLARYQAVLVSRGDLGSPLEDLLEDLVRFLTAGLSAPVGAAPNTGAQSQPNAAGGTAAVPARQAATASRGGRTSGRGKPA